jgi:hypothetical protein
VSPPALASEHQHSSGAFSFRVPAAWKVGPLAGHPEATEAWGDLLGVRFVYHAGEVGLDSLHVNCMLERLAGPMDMQPQVRYEYDFLGGAVADRRALDSAFSVQYDRPVQGQREWRQRNLTVVGRGHSLCIVTYAPLPVWKRSPDARALLDAVLGSIVLR